MGTKPILFHSPGSHHCRRVALLIEELGLNVETEFVDVRPPGMGGQNESPEFLALNPNAKVPVLKHENVVLTESNAIMFYLCDLAGDTHFMPEDPAQRASVLSWQFWQAAHLSPTADALMKENMMKPMVGQSPDPQIIESLWGDFDRWAKVLELQLELSQYLAGDRLTCADLSIVSALMYQHAAQIPVQDYSRLSNWVTQIQGRPSWQATEPPPMPVGP